MHYFLESAEYMSGDVHMYIQRLDNYIESRDVSIGRQLFLALPKPGPLSTACAPPVGPIPGFGVQPEVQRLYYPVCY